MGVQMLGTHVWDGFQEHMHGAWGSCAVLAIGMSTCVDICIYVWLCVHARMCDYVHGCVHAYMHTAGTSMLIRAWRRACPGMPRRAAEICACRDVHDEMRMPRRVCTEVHAGMAHIGGWPLNIDHH